MFVVMGNWVMGVGCCSQGFGIAYCVVRCEVEVEELVDGRVRSLLGSNAGCGKRDLFTVHKPRELNPQRGFPQLQQLIEYFHFIFIVYICWTSYDKPSGILVLIRFNVVTLKDPSYSSGRGDVQQDLTIPDDTGHKKFVWAEKKKHPELRYIYPC
jgi:hypothetical protein